MKKTALLSGTLAVLIIAFTLSCGDDRGAPACIDNDSDGYYSTSGCGTDVDCDDNDPNVYPNTTEICNDLIDNNCNNKINEDCIIFNSDRDINEEIYIIDANGGGQTNLTNNPAWDGRAAWSPDGTKIAFQSDRDGNHEIYVMDADGSSQTNLTNNPASDGRAAWSPDGTKIAFQTLRDDLDGVCNVTSGTMDCNHEIYVMDANGDNQIRLTNNSADEVYFVWSPDGSKIAFVSDRDGDYEIYVMDTDGSNQSNLTNSPGGNGSPAWSPDGTKIAFVSGRHDLDGICDYNFGTMDCDSEIYIMNVVGSNQTNLTNNPASDYFPAWSPK